MPVSKERLAQIISGKAAQMCSPQNQRMYDKMANSNNGLNENFNADPRGDAALAQYEQMLGYGSSSSQPKYSGDINYSPDSFEYSRMDPKIKASMMNENIDRSALGNSSALDELGITPNRMPQRQVVTEQQTYVPQSNGSIDYSIIKAIVKECLNEYMSKLPLNEGIGSLQTIGLSGGNIRLVDNKGNVFQAKLEKIGNNKNNK